MSINNRELRPWADGTQGGGEIIGVCVCEIIGAKFKKEQTKDTNIFVYTLPPYPEARLLNQHISQIIDWWFKPLNTTRAF